MQRNTLRGGGVWPRVNMRRKSWMLNLFAFKIDKRDMWAISNFWVSGWNPKVLPLKWNLFHSTFIWCQLFCDIYKNLSSVLVLATAARIAGSIIWHSSAKKDTTHIKTPNIDREIQKSLKRKNSCSLIFSNDHTTRQIYWKECFFFSALIVVS